MENFTFHTPTEIIFGKGSENKTVDLVKKYGGTQALVVYGKNSVIKSGILGKILTDLKSAGINSTEHGGAMPNPHLSFVYEGIKKAINSGVNFILAVGGGSAIDAAKAIAHGVANPDKDVWNDFWLRKEELKKSTPVGVVLTISAAGSETSNSAVITNTETKQKRGLPTDFNRPRFAVMNPEFTYTLPKYQIACGIADIFMHTLDRYFAPESGKGLKADMTDGIAEALLKVLIKHGPAALDNPSDYSAQSEIMWAGSLSHNGITGLGRTFDFSVHQLGHELGAMFDVAHGASLTTMWGNWARHVKHVNIPRFAHYARTVWNAAISDDNAAADEGIKLTEKFFTQIGMPVCFSELGVGVQDFNVINDLANRCVFGGARKVGVFLPLNEDDCTKIYTAANR